MRFALLSDVHGQTAKLQAVLADARARAADQIVSLGDVGGDDCVALLRQAGALVVFGNYEVSGWQSLDSRHQAWVRGWPPLLNCDHFLAAHAVPWWPKDLAPERITVPGLGLWMRQTGRSWRHLFPYLTDGETGLWRALAELEARGKVILFHGHTHLQTAWRLISPNQMGQIEAALFTVRNGERCVVGVGSVGFPEDGGWAAYSLYDTASNRIERVRLAGKPVSHSLIHSKLDL